MQLTRVATLWTSACGLRALESGRATQTFCCCGGDNLFLFVLFHFLFKYFKAPIFHLRLKNTSNTSDAREVVQDASNLMSLFCFFDTLPSSCVLSFNHHICEMDHMIMYSFIPCFGRSSVRLSSSFRRRCAVGREPATISAVVLRFLFPDPRPRQLPSWLAGAAE